MPGIRECLLEETAVPWVLVVEYNLPGRQYNEALNIAKNAKGHTTVGLSIETGFVKVQV